MLCYNNRHNYMVHLSKRRVKKETFIKIGKQLAEFICGLETTQNTKILLETLISEPERIMLAKRLAVIIMLGWGYSFSQISGSLKVSESTVVNVWKKMKKGRLRSLEEHFKKVGRKTSFWDNLEEFLRFGLPPRGRGRWAWFLNDPEIIARRNSRPAPNRGM